MKKTVVCVGILSLVLGGCGKSRSGSNFVAKPTSASGALSEEDAKGIAFWSDIGTDVMTPEGGSEIFWQYVPHDDGSSSLRNMRGMALKMFSGLVTQRNFGSSAEFHAAATPANCAKISSGSLTDSDQDGIPDAVRVEVNCSQSDLGKNSWIDLESGTLNAQDKDAQNPRGGYLIDASNYKASLTGEDDQKQSVKVDFEGQSHNDQTVAGDVVTTSSDVTLAMSSASMSFTMGHYLQSVVQYIPADEQGVTHFVVKDLKGFMQFRGSGSQRGAAKMVDVVLAVSADNLTSDSDCYGNFRTGSITLKDAGGNTLVHSYQDCEKTTTYNGKELKKSYAKN
ncbi:MAG: hypothetical protein JST16_11105 [Bdellovibrionales bacterium]|nr:hypothetical protein [Bdellovibrionales bacterium]